VAPAHTQGSSNPKDVESQRANPIQHALVLTAGHGTRLRPLSDVRAKPAIPVAGEPMIRRIIRWLVSQGVADLVLNLHHRPETITAVVGDGQDLEARVRYSWEQPQVLGSAGGPRLALPLVAADTFLIVNGDTLTDLDLEPVAAAHIESRALVTLALVPNREFERYGGVRLDDDDRVIGFVARGPAAAGSWHFIGVQVANASVFADLDTNVPAKTIGGVYDALIASVPGAVRGFRCDTEFWDVGTVADYWRTSMAFMRKEGQTGSSVGQAARIDLSARITESILWDDVEVGAGAAIEKCIVTDGVSIPAGATYESAVLVAGESATVRAMPR
jgi:mannose-1-phosphate guanylyltransferase